jgi:hypothetical protein
MKRKAGSYTTLPSISCTEKHDAWDMLRNAQR